MAFRGACFIFAEKPYGGKEAPDFHLTLDDAVKLHAALGQFIREAKAIGLITTEQVRR